MGISGNGNTGVSTNSIISGTGNNGSRGKIPDKLLDFRLRMHAERLIKKVPSFKTMVVIWKNEHNITIAEQSEKEWSHVQKNKDRINAMANSMIDSMELEVAPVSSETLTNSLIQITRENVKRLKQVTQVEKDLLNGINKKIEPYKIIGISKEKYMNSKPEERREYDAKAKMELDVYKINAGVLKDVSAVGKNANDCMMSAVDQADKINKRNEKFQLLMKQLKAKPVSDIPEKPEDEAGTGVIGDFDEDQRTFEQMRQMVDDNE